MRQSRAVRSVVRFLVAVSLVLACVPGVFAETLKDIGPPTNYVTDLAGVLNDSTKQDLDALCRSVEQQANAQVFVVTLHRIGAGGADSADGDADVQTFATDLYHQWKIGSSKTDRGVLLLFSIDDHKRWITTGYGLEGILPDGKVGDIGREMVPDLQAGDFNGAVRTGVNDVASVIAKDAGVTLQTQTPRPVRRRSSGGGGSLWGLLLFFGLMFLFFRGGRGGRGGGGGGGFLPGLILGGLMGGGRGGGGYGGGFDGGGGGFGGGGDSGGGFSGGGGGDTGGGGAGGGW